MQALENYLLYRAGRRFDEFSVYPFSVLQQNLDIFALFPQNFVSLLFDRKEAVGAILANISRRAEDRNDPFLKYFISRLHRYYFTHNQFLVIDRTRGETMYDTYRSFFRGFGKVVLGAVIRSVFEDEVHTFMREHQQRLIELTGDILRDNADAGSRFLHSEQVNEQYSPQLQLALLNIRPETMAGPVLDVGCGSRAGLVHCLRGCGIKAYGIDLFVEAEEGLSSGDWLTFDPGENRWGTIVSHLAFSNHFLHQHFRPGGKPERYAAQYMRLLKSLKKGGSFHYAPGLPFIEDLLPAQNYLVRRSEIDFGAESGQQLTGAAEVLELMSAVEVVRLK